jgi:hypothetical protein
LKILKISSSKSKNIMKGNNEYLRIFHLLKWIFQNELIIQQTSVEMAQGTTVTKSSIVNHKLVLVQGKLLSPNPTEMESFSPGDIQQIIKL